MQGWSPTILLKHIMLAFSIEKASLYTERFLFKFTQIDKLVLKYWFLYFLDQKGSDEINNVQPNEPFHTSP